MVTISQWKKYENQIKHTGYDWRTSSVEEAIKEIGTLGVSGRDSIYVIESEYGTVLEVVNTY